MTKIKIISFVLFVTCICIWNFPVYAASGTIERERPLITAAQITQLGASFKEAAEKMIKNGAQAEDLISIKKREISLLAEAWCSEKHITCPPTLPKNTFEGYYQLKFLNFRLYDIAGKGRVTFSGANKIPSIGTESPEILYIVWPIREEICSQINRGLGLEVHKMGILVDFTKSHILANPPNLAEKSDTPTTIQFQDSKDPVPAFACVQDAKGVRYYYHTIVER